jgi:hypothetical protein
VNVGTARALFTVPLRVNDYGYDLSPDGQRLLLNLVGSGSRTPLILVRNWTAELEAP